MRGTTINHFASLRSLPILPLRRGFVPSSPTTVQRSVARKPVRAYSSEQSSRPPSPNAQFYRTFGRPIAKVFLLAIFTYQVTYYFWTRLEQEEIQDELTATISRLEDKVEQLEKARKT